MAPPALLARLEAQLGGRVAVGAVRSLHGGESPWWIEATTPCGSALARVHAVRLEPRRFLPFRPALNTPTEWYSRDAERRVSPGRDRTAVKTWAAHVGLWRRRS